MVRAIWFSYKISGMNDMVWGWQNEHIKEKAAYWIPVLMLWFGDIICDFGTNCWMDNVFCNSPNMCGGFSYTFLIYIFKKGEKRSYALLILSVNGLISLLSC